MTPPFVLVAGLDRLGLAVIRELTQRGVEVGVIASAGALARHEHELTLLGARPCSGAAHLEGVLAMAGLGRASALVLTADDDSGNIDTAITARRLNPTLRIVARIFDTELAEFVRETLGEIVVLSISQIVAPIFAELGLRAADVPAEAPPRGRRLRPLRSSRGLDRNLIALGLTFAGLVTVAVLYFRAALGLPFIDALYFVGTTITTTGYGDISLLHAGAAAKLAGLALMFGGATLLAVLFGLVSSWFVGRRLEIFEGRVPARGRGHIVVCGAGNVGFRVVGQLQQAGQRVVVIERDPTNRNAAVLRQAGSHVILADATSEVTLALARVERARAVLALTDDDTANLRIARTVAQAAPDVPIILRIVSAELAAHVNAASARRMQLLSPIAVASGRFADAALEALSPSVAPPRTAPPAPASPWGRAPA